MAALPKRETIGASALDGGETPSVAGAEAPAPWAVAAELETPQGLRQVGTGRDATAGPREKRVMKLDGEYV
ncbi:MAG: hypothetical protein P8X52_03440, partial [Limibacillus sp.]